MLRYNDSDLELYTDTEGKSRYTGKDFCVKMLVEEYTVNKYITTQNIPVATSP